MLRMIPRRSTSRTRTKKRKRKPPDASKPAVAPVATEATVVTTLTTRMLTTRMLTTRTLTTRTTSDISPYLTYIILLRVCSNMQNILTFTQDISKAKYQLFKLYYLYHQSLYIYIQTITNI